MLRQKVTALESRLDGKAASRNSNDYLFTLEGQRPEHASPFMSSMGARSTFPAMFFLDSEVYQGARLSIPCPTVNIPHDVILALGSMSDIRVTAEQFFSTVHVWLPIVSKKRLQLKLSISNVEPTPDLVLLLLCMKLVTQNGFDGPFSAQTSIYWAIKSYFSLLESSAMMSIQLVQSAVLIATYEIGHAIYPAAYLTTGCTARLGYALGIHRRETAPQMIKRPGAWAETEEMRRVWWAVMLMDRYVSLGGNDRPLATEDPLRTHILPADDTLWDHGEMTTSEPFYVSSPTSVKAGAFARTCQATHLLGRLIRMLNERQDESSVRFTEAKQIYRTIKAFTNILPPEVEQSPEHFMTAMALSYAALLRLCDVFACVETNRGEHTVEETEMQTIAIAGLKSTSADALQLAQLLRHTMTTNLAATSPLTADCLYQTAAQYAWLCHETEEPEMVASYHAVVETLTLMNGRWAVAGEYLKVLDTAQETLYNNNPLLARAPHH